MRMDAEPLLEPSHGDICGETIEHNLRSVGDGVWECRRCGAEIIEELTGEEQTRAYEAEMWEAD